MVSADKQESLAHSVAFCNVLFVQNIIFSMAVMRSKLRPTVNHENEIRPAISKYAP